jgi:uncharacterized membrane protein
MQSAWFFHLEIKWLHRWRHIQNSCNDLTLLHKVLMSMVVPWLVYPTQDVDELEIH